MQTTIINSRINLRKSKGILPKEGLFKLALPKLAQIAVNLVQLGPRIILRSALQLLRANIWTRIISVAVVVTIDLIQFLRKKISKKQLVVNLILSFALLFGATTGWIFATNSVHGIAAENSVLWIIAGVLGAGIFSSVMDKCCKKVLGRFIVNDIDDMLRLINLEFERMVDETRLSDAQADSLAATIEIDDKICLQCFAKSNKQKYICDILQPYFNKFV